MKDDYLWDRTGEPDPDVQSLESILGNLRHKGKAPEMLAQESLRRVTSAPRPKMFYKPLLAAAALLLMMFTALSLWLVINRTRGQQSAQPQMARGTAAPPAQQQSPPPESPGPQKEVLTPQPGGVKQLAASDNPAPRPRRSKPGQRENMSARNLANQQEAAEGRIAKERLIKALQITSSTLNFAQKKARVEKELDPPS